MAKHNGKSPCGGKKQKKKKAKPTRTCCGTKRSPRIKKKRAKSNIPCKDIRHHAKNCSACKREIKKRKAKRPPRKLHLYQKFYAFISQRLRSKYPGIDQCLVMKKAAQCWRKLTKEQKEDFKRRCDRGEFDKSGRGRNSSCTPSSGNRSDGGGNGGCCSVRPSPEENFSSLGLPPVSQQPSRWLPSSSSQSSLNPYYSSSHFRRSPPLKSSIFRRSSPLECSSLGTTTYTNSPMPDSFPSHYFGTGKSFP